MDCLGKEDRLGEVWGRNILHLSFSRLDQEVNWGFERWEQEEVGVSKDVCVE